MPPPPSPPTIRHIIHIYFQVTYAKGKLYLIVGLPYNNIYLDNFTKNPNLIIKYPGTNINQETLTLIEMETEITQQSVTYWTRQ